MIASGAGSHAWTMDVSRAPRGWSLGARADDSAVACSSRICNSLLSQWLASSSAGLSHPPPLPRQATARARHRSVVASSTMVRMRRRASSDRRGPASMMATRMASRLVFSSETSSSRVARAIVPSQLFVDSVLMKQRSSFPSWTSAVRIRSPAITQFPINTYN